MTDLGLTAPFSFQAVTLYLLRLPVFVLGLHVLIKVGLGRLHIGPQPEEADTQRQDAKQEPADKRQVQIEQVELVPPHHRHAALYGPVELQFGTIAHHIRRHGVGIRLDEAGHDEQQRPEERVDAHQQGRAENAGVVAKAHEQLLHAVFAAIPIIVEEGHRQAVAYRQEEQLQHAAEVFQHTNIHRQRKPAGHDHIDKRDHHCPAPFSGERSPRRRPHLACTSYHNCNALKKGYYSMTTLVHPCTSGSMPYWMLRKWL